MSRSDNLQWCPSVLVFLWLSLYGAVFQEPSSQGPSAQADPIPQGRGTEDCLSKDKKIKAWPAVSAQGGVGYLQGRGLGPKGLGVQVQSGTHVAGT